ncbi:MAG: penicillin-binding protein 1C [Bacteroidales bacterium]|nr:penicillin-binding protein 1C [Bacteroidales bacterium]
MKKHRTRAYISVLVLATILIAGMLVPVPRFDKPLSVVTESEDGRLMGAHIASDGQWRFPQADSVNRKYRSAVVNCEDRYFYSHPGVNPVSLVRSLYLNIKNHEIVSGGSTITMQLARMSGDNPPRTVPRKMLEILMALKMELLCSKEEILGLYAANAPFGGNVVGIESASWRYFGRQPDDLSWAEACMLAVLPNAPSMIYPGRNDPRLKIKRDELLKMLWKRGVIDSTTCRLALAEPLPEKVYDLPSLAPHITGKYITDGRGGRFKTTLDYDLQEKVMTLADRQLQVNSRNEVHNIAAVVVEVESGKILAYAGNVNTDKDEHGGMVDMITAPRSTGSILKPFLYAAMLESGELLPDMLVPDVPVEFSGYSPKNFNLEYNGAVPAAQALQRSLNVPAVEMLRGYSPDRFLLFLRGMGFSTFNRDADHYGLSLILGGGEASLLELAGSYAWMALKLKNYDKKEYERAWCCPYYDNKMKKEQEDLDGLPLSAASIWFTFKALQDVNRPQGRIGWKSFSSSGKIAWKTGTSFGFRDAWAIGFNADYVVGVWAGNADGEGRPGLTGVTCAAPLLFDVFDLLGEGEWFEPPTSEMEEVEICLESGHRASSMCTKTAMMMIPRSGLISPVCPYHEMIHLSSDLKYRVTDDCYSPAEMKHVSWFVLPPAQEWYYRKQHPEYHNLPGWLPGCNSRTGEGNLELLYPRNLQGLYVPVEHDGQRGKIVFEAAPRNINNTLYWHLDDRYIGETRLIHQVGLAPEPGEHILTIVDSDGNQFTQKINILGDGEGSRGQGAGSREEMRNER